MFSLVENEGRQRRRRKPPDGAKEQGQQLPGPLSTRSTTQVNDSTTSTSQLKCPYLKAQCGSTPGVRQAPGRTEVAGPMSGFRVPLLAATVPPHVSGAMSRVGFR